MITRYFLVTFVAAVLAGCTQTAPTPTEQMAQDQAQKSKKDEDFSQRHTGW